MILLYWTRSRVYLTLFEIGDSAILNKGIWHSIYELPIADDPSTPAAKYGAGDRNGRRELEGRSDGISVDTNFKGNTLQHKGGRIVI